MKKPVLKTLKELKSIGYQSRSIKEEMRQNLIPILKTGKHPFEGIHGYENSVIPAVEQGILAAHDILLLGLRGQAKSRIARQMIELLDDWIPSISGTDLNEDPLQPISHQGKELYAKHGDNLEISWIHKS